MNEYTISRTENGTVLWRKDGDKLVRIGNLTPHGLLYNSADESRSRKLCAAGKFGVHDFGRGVFVHIRREYTETWLLVK